MVMVIDFGCLPTCWTSVFSVLMCVYICTTAFGLFNVYYLGLLCFLCVRGCVRVCLRLCWHDAIDISMNKVDC